MQLSRFRIHDVPVAIDAMRANRADGCGGRRPASVLARAAIAALLAAACALLPVAAPAQEAIVKAEELIRLQWIPYSRMTTFEQQYPQETLDYSAWLILRALDSSSAWTPRNRAWDLYRINLRYDIEQVFRRRWQAAGGTIRSLSENPDTSLAKFYADTLSAEQMEQMLAFFRTDAGKKYLRYLLDIRRTYYRGSLELDRISIDPDYGATGDSATVRRKAWLSKKNISLEPPPPGYDFHIKAAQGIFTGADAMDLVFSLLAGAPPGSEAYTRIDQIIPAADREEVVRFLGSPAFSKERQARRNWSDTIVKNKSLMPLLVGNLFGMVEMLAEWKKIRVMPTALPLSVSQIDPASLQIPAEYPLLKLEDDETAAALRACMPKLSDASIKNLTRDNNGRSYREFSSLIRMTDAKYIIATRREFAACVPTTAPGYPIPALNSFLDTVRIGGIDDAESRRWYQGIAQEIGATGASESLVILENGGAHEISYAVNVRSPQMLVYLVRFFPAGTYDPSRYRTVMKSANYRALSVMSTGGSDGAQRREKSLITTPDDVRRFEERTKRTVAPPDRKSDNPEKSRLGVLIIAGEGLNSRYSDPKALAVSATLFSVSQKFSESLRDEIEKRSTEAQIYLNRDVNSASKTYVPLLFVDKRRDGLIQVQVTHIKNETENAIYLSAKYSPLQWLKEDKGESFIPGKGPEIRHKLLGDGLDGRSTLLSAYAIEFADHLLKTGYIGGK